jgi:hypothetical protein
MQRNTIMSLEWISRLFEKSEREEEEKKKWEDRLREKDKGSRCTSILRVSARHQGQQ